MKLQAVKDDASDQNFRAIKGRFPIQSNDVADKAVADRNLEKPAIVGAVTAAGGIEVGEGFAASRTATGTYKITLTTELPTLGVILVTGRGTFTQLWKVSGPSKTSFTVSCNGIIFSESKEIAADEPFHFLIKAT